METNENIDIIRVLDITALRSNLENGTIGYLYSASTSGSIVLHVKSSL